MNAAHGKPHQRFDEARALWGPGSGSPHAGAHVEFLVEVAAAEGGAVL